MLIRDSDFNQPETTLEYRSTDGLRSCVTKAVADSADSLNERRAVTELSANGSDMHVNCAFKDKRITESGIDQFRTGERSAGLSDQHVEQSEFAGRQVQPTVTFCYIVAFPVDDNSVACRNVAVVLN